MYKQSAILVSVLCVLLLAMYESDSTLTAEEISHEQLLNSTMSELRAVMDEHTPSECIRGAALIINGRYSETEPMQNDYGRCMRIAVRAWRGE